MMKKSLGLVKSDKKTTHHKVLPHKNKNLKKVLRNREGGEKSKAKGQDG